MSAIEVFSFDDKSVRTFVIDGDPWFLAADVCDVLDIGNVSMAVGRLDEDGVSTTEVIDSLGRRQSAKIVSESGLYELVFLSRKPNARAFKRWVTLEVLPSIRKTGSYGVSSVDPAQVSRSDLARLVLESERELEQARGVIAELAPVAAHMEVLDGARGARTVGDIANDFKVYAGRVFPGVRVFHGDVRDHAGRSVTRRWLSVTRRWLVHAHDFRRREDHASRSCAQERLMRARELQRRVSGGGP
jgi:prophage antirepressor-like protein